MMAAIAASSSGAEVFVFDKNEYPGRKLLQTGNGKCNFSNVSISEDNYRGSLVSGGILKEVFDFCGRDELLKLFSSFGLLYRIKNEGYYPASFAASTVNDVLIFEMKKNKVSFHPLTQVKEISREGDRFFLTLNHLKTNRRSKDETGFDAVIIASGGVTAPKTGSTGDGYYLAKSFSLEVSDPLPGLTRLMSSDPFFNDNKIRTEASLKLLIDGETKAVSFGELQLTEGGPSGICVFDLSGRASYALKDKKRTELLMDLLPDHSEEEVFRLLKRRILSTTDDYEIPGIFTGIFSERLSINILKHLEDRVFAGRLPRVLDDDDIRKISSEIKGLRVEITGTGDFNSSQITAGGVKAGSLGPGLCAREVKGLCFAGEVLDIDGDCGGYNLQWAFSSGFYAGKKAAES